MQICKFFFADSKSRAQELSNNVSFVIIGHQTWDLEGGQIDPPIISWFSSTPIEIGLMHGALSSVSTDSGCQFKNVIIVTMMGAS